MSENAGSYLVVFDNLGSEMDVELDHRQSIDAAVQLWADSYGNRDTLLTLTMMNGGEVTILASSLTGWLTTTPETRSADLARELAKHKEESAYRAITGDDGWQDTDS